VSGRLAISLLGLLLVSCKASPNEGFVAVNVPRGFTVPPITIALDSWVGSPGPETFSAKPDGSPVVVRRRSGSYQLLVKRNEQLIPVCKFDVRQDRVTTVTLKPVGRELRCEVVA
jgi:hypothetical protein